MYEDELLSSYVARLIHLLGCPAHTFCRQVLDDPKALRRDIDLYSNSSLEQQLKPFGFKEHLPLSDRLKWTRCRETFLPQSPDVLNINIIGAVRTKYGQQFCPECFKEAVYFKWTWRLAVIPICTRHGVLLRDRCPHCHQPIMNAKVSSLVRNLGVCSSCWSSMLVETKSVSDDDANFIQRIEQAIISGWFSYEGFQMYAPLFFRGLWRIIYSIYGTKGRSKKVWKSL